MAQVRGEFVLLELEAKALKAVDLAWVAYLASEPECQAVPFKIVEMMIDVHKMVMQRMNAKYGLDKGVTDLKMIVAALDKEKELTLQMIAQRERDGESLQ